MQLQSGWSPLHFKVPSGLQLSRHGCLKSWSPDAASRIFKSFSRCGRHFLRYCLLSVLGNLCIIWAENWSLFCHIIAINDGGWCVSLSPCCGATAKPSPAITYNHYTTRLTKYKYNWERISFEKAGPCQSLWRYFAKVRPLVLSGLLPTNSWLKTDLFWHKNRSSSLKIVEVIFIWKSRTLPVSVTLRSKSTTSCAVGTSTNEFLVKNWPILT